MGTWRNMQSKNAFKKKGIGHACYFNRTILDNHKMVTQFGGTTLSKMKFVKLPKDSHKMVKEEHEETQQANTEKALRFDALLSLKERGLLVILFLTSFLSSKGGFNTPCSCFTTKSGR